MIMIIKPFYYPRVFIFKTAALIRCEAAGGGAEYRVERNVYPHRIVVRVEKRVCEITSFGGYYTVCCEYSVYYGGASIECTL